MSFLTPIGSLWASAPFLFLAPGDPSSNGLIMVTMYALGAGSVPMLLYHPPSTTTLLVFMFVSLAAKLFMLGGSERIRMGIAALAFMLVMLSLGWVQARVTRESIRLRHENLDLVEDLRRQKDATEAALARAEEASRARSRFFAAANHDLRQPLHALGLFSATLREMTPEPDRRAIVDHMHSSIDALGSLFDELLDISRLDAGFVQARLSHFPVAVTLEAIRTQFAAVAEAKGLALQVASCDAVICSDVTLLLRTLSHLVLNGLRHTAAGHVIAGCRRHGDQLRIEILDTGPGIPADQHVRIFEEFYQLDNPKRDRRKGPGLGLATVKRLTSLLGHSLQLESVVGPGTAFRLDVPLGERGRIQAASEPAIAIVDVLARKRIVVDDELTIRKGMQELLTRWGCVPVTAASSAQATTL